MKRRHSKSKEFELLAARIERALAPVGATVKSPDRIRDKFTGQYREVDASIRFQVGSCTLLITIECRDRSRVQDVNWIEQLATKRSHIGADRTIAVSSTPFAATAVKAAAFHNISLRRIADLTDTEICGLVGQLKVTSGELEMKLGPLSLMYCEPASGPVSLQDEARDLYTTQGWDACIFRVPDAKAQLSMSDLIARCTLTPSDEARLTPPLVENAVPPLVKTDPLMLQMQDVPHDGTPITKNLTIYVMDELVSVSTNHGIRALKEISFEVTARLHNVHVPAMKVIDYSDEQRTLGRFTEHTVPLDEKRALQVLSHTPIQSASPQPPDRDET